MGKEIAMKRAVLWAILLVLGGLSGFHIASYAKAGDEAEIRKLIDNFAVAFRAKDVDKVMSFYEKSDKLVAFDVVPPRQYTGWEAYRKDFKDLFDMFNGPVTLDISDVSVASEGNMAYSHSIDHVVGTGKDGNKMDLTVRVTDVYRKIGGKWLIVHEHVSVPVDLATGRGDLQSKP
jgi:uncharacterized protein (TIGR02246 family)